MHTLEMAVVLPLLFFVLLGGLFFSIRTVLLIDRQINGYAQTPCMEASDCVHVIRIVEVTYDLLEEVNQ